MTRNRPPSPQAYLVIEALAARAHEWRYGYDLSKETGLKSGTLYPLLIRLTEQGALEAEWREAALPGRPPRHAYRLTAKGLSLAAAAPISSIVRTRVQPA